MRATYWGGYVMLILNWDQCKAISICQLWILQVSTARPRIFCKQCLASTSTGLKLSGPVPFFDWLNPFFLEFVERSNHKLLKGSLNRGTWLVKTKTYLTTKFGYRCNYTTVRFYLNLFRQSINSFLSAPFPTPQTFFDQGRFWSWKKGRFYWWSPHKKLMRFVDGLTKAYSM